MPKQSLKKPRKVRLGCYISQFVGCCGIGILQDFDWYLNNSLLDFDNNNYIYKKEMIPILKQETNKALKRFPVIYATVVDECKVGMNQIAAMKTIGWVEEHTAKSKHGNYMIHVLSKKR